MRKLTLAVTIVLFFAGRYSSSTGQSKSQATGGQEMFGAYDIVTGWPKDISTIPGNEKWTWGAAQSVFAESPNRVFMLYRGELPNIQRPRTQLLKDFAPSIQFPIGRLPWRDATV